MKKTISILALASLYSTQLLATPAVEPAVEGQISTLGELRWLSDNYEAWTKDWVLTSDIDASDTQNWNSGEGFVPIGNLHSYGFRSVFDAQGYTISNLHINRPTEDKVGLFGFLNGGSVKNLKLLNPVVVGNDYVGSLVGTASGATVLDLTVTSPIVTGVQVVGGVAGSDSNTIANRVDVTDARVAGSLQTGGYAGKGDYKDMDGMSLTATVTSDGNETGGIWGRTTFSKNDRYGTGIKNVVFNGVVTSTGNHTGGVAGYTTGSNYINGLISDASVTSTGLYTGLGFGGAEQVELYNMTLKGSVRGTDYVGGLAGRFEDNVRYSWMKHEGITIDATIVGGDYVGGVAGFSGSTTGTAHTVTSRSIVHGINNVGGFYGAVDNGARSGRDNFFFGHVEGETNVGGFYGLAGAVDSEYLDFELIDSAFMGTIKGNSNVGGFVGKVYGNTPDGLALKMYDSYIKGVITAQTDVAGITPYIGSKDLYFADSYVDVEFVTPKGVGEAAIVIDSELPNARGFGFHLIYNNEKSTHNHDHFYAKGVSSNEMTDEATFHNYEFSTAWMQDKWQIVDGVGSPTRVLAPIPIFSSPNETEGGIPEQKMELGDSYTFNVSAHEQVTMDSTNVTYSLEASAPEFVSLDPHGLLTVSPTLDSHLGSYDVVVVAKVGEASNKLPVLKITVEAIPEPEPDNGGDNSGDNGGDNSGDNGGDNGGDNSGDNGDDGGDNGGDNSGDNSGDTTVKGRKSGGSLGGFVLLGMTMLGLRRKLDVA